MYNCKICNENFLTIRELSNHLRFSEKIKVKQYYDTYIKQANEGICPVCGKQTSFDCLELGYKRHCSYKCSNSDIDVQRKQQKTTLEHYGVLHPAQNQEIVQKMQQTSLEKYGALNGHGDIQKRQMKQKCLRDYGVESTWQRKDVIQKIKQTKLLKYQDENYTNREGFAKTLLERYGIDNLSSLPDWQDKVRNTKLLRYGSMSYNNASKMGQTKQEIKTTFELEHNCTAMQTVFDMYGCGWYYVRLVPVIFNNALAYVHNEDIPKIEQYASIIHTSQFEDKLLQFIQTFYSKNIIKHSRKIIAPLEVDIYLPDMKIGIEFNGTYWHSVEQGKSKRYHLEKSLACREKGIRLIHIYEFEDFEQQKQLLKDLIEGKDNYPPQDFNKNNLLDFIPRPCIIYKKDYTVYGAGKLY